MLLPPVSVHVNLNCGFKCIFWRFGLEFESLHRKRMLINLWPVASCCLPHSCSLSTCCGALQHDIFDSGSWQRMFKILPGSNITWRFCFEGRSQDNVTDQVKLWGHNAMSVGKPEQEDACRVQARPVADPRHIRVWRDRQLPLCSVIAAAE